MSEKTLETLSDAWLLEAAAAGTGRVRYRFNELVLCFAHEQARPGGPPAARC